MSTRTAALPVERNYLVRAWLVVAAIVIVASAIGFALLRSDGVSAGPGRDAPSISQIVDYGPSSVNHGPIVINGKVCGQCR